jgi:CheY-like chemotaxis protein
MGSRTGHGPVLVVEDEADVREGLAELLDAEGYPVVTATNGREALQRLRDEPRPRLVLLDLMMPVADGWTFREEQQRDGAVADIPVVVLSAASVSDSQAERLGASAYLMKPIDGDTLVSVIRAHDR